MSESSHGLRAGEVLGGRFRIVRRLGAGGMGEVFEAADLELGVAVAVKTIRSDRPERAARFLEQLREEVKVARRVTHPNVCRIFDVGRDGDRVFFTMELVDGETLAALFQRRGRIPPAEALPLARQMAAGLDALHAVGIVHRDFKPGNVIVAEGRAVITDFGLARPQEETMTMDSPGVAHIAGTPDYMAPEQLLGKSLSPATDVYALGLVLYEMVAGVRAYPGGRALENAVQRLAEMPPPPSSQAPDVPREWDAAILHCLERDPAARPATAGAVIAAIVGDDVRPPGMSRRRAALLVAGVGAATAATTFVWSRMGLTRRLSPSAAGANATYLKGQDALEHYYRPHGVEDAMRLFDETIAKDPGFALAYAGLARANFLQYWQMRDPKYIEPARSYADKALQLDAKLASVHVTLGRLYTETSQNDLAAQELNQALKLDPRSAEAHYALGALYDKQGRKDEVGGEYQKAMDLAPEDWRFPDNLADYYLGLGKFDKAVELSTLAVKLSQDNPRALTNLGRAYRRLGRLDEARVTYEKAIAIEPSMIAYANQGLVLDEQGKSSEAAEIYRKAIGLKPDYYVLWGNLGFSLRATPGRDTEAKEAFQKAVDLAEELRKHNPKDAELLSAMGRYYAILGARDQSLNLVRQAVALAPDNAQVLLRAASSNELLHRRGEALSWIGKALAHGLRPSALEGERSLSSLRQDPEFQKLITTYKPNQ